MGVTEREECRRGSTVKPKEGRAGVTNFQGGWNCYFGCHWLCGVKMEGEGVEVVSGVRGMNSIRSEAT